MSLVLEEVYCWVLGLKKWKGMLMKNTILLGITLSSLIPLQQPVAKPAELTADKVFTELRSTESGTLQLELATAKASIKVLQQNWAMERQLLLDRIKELEAQLAEKGNKKPAP